MRGVGRRAIVAGRAGVAHSRAERTCDRVGKPRLGHDRRIDGVPMGERPQECAPGAPRVMPERVAAARGLVAARHRGGGRMHAIGHTVLRGSRARREAAVDGSVVARARSPAPTTTTLDLSALPVLGRCVARATGRRAGTGRPRGGARCLRGGPARRGERRRRCRCGSTASAKCSPTIPTALAPASNQKLFTAMGALAVLGPDTDSRPRCGSRRRATS